MKQIYVIIALICLTTTAALAAEDYTCTLSGTKDSAGDSGTATIKQISAKKISMKVKYGKGPKRVNESADLALAATKKTSRNRFVQAHADGDGFFVVYLPTEQPSGAFTARVMSFDNDAGSCDGDDCMGEFVAADFDASCK
jgi:hypothetical protein